MSEISARALSFWQYQYKLNLNRITQESKYQEYERKDLEDKKKGLERKVQLIYNEAKNEISSKICLFSH